MDIAVNRFRLNTELLEYFQNFQISTVQEQFDGTNGLLVVFFLMACMKCSNQIVVRLQVCHTARLQKLPKRFAEKYLHVNTSSLQDAFHKIARVHLCYNLSNYIFIAMILGGLTVSTP